MKQQVCVSVCRANRGGRQVCMGSCPRRQVCMHGVLWNARVQYHREGEGKLSEAKGTCIVGTVME